MGFRDDEVSDVLEFDTNGIRVLHVDDEENIAELTALQLEKSGEEIEVLTESNADAGLERLENEWIDCVVSDYNMPGKDGLEFLRAVREYDPELPFILFTGRGSEEIASEAISNGVTDYLQKEVGTEQYTVLANRIQNTVEQYRAVKEVERTREFYSRILDHSSDYVIIVGDDGTIDYVSPAVERVMGYPPDELVGTNSFKFAHPDDREYAFDALLEVLEKPNEDVTVEFRSKHDDGSWRWIEVRGGNQLDDPIIEGIMVNVRDVTDRKQQEQDLERQTERMEELTKFMSHDVKNQLAIIDGRLELASDEVKNENLEAARGAIDRVDEMIEKVKQLVESGAIQLDENRVSLDSMVSDCWSNVRAPESTLNLESDLEIEADNERLRSLLENLFRNAVEHGGSDVTIRVGSLEERTGFFVEDNGDGLDVDSPEQVFESGFTTSDSGTGLGLAIVKQVVDAHDWSIDVKTPADGGVRFEISDVETV
ncbi:MAG: PAS domain S-box protein [Natronomonas sp.]